MPTSAHQLITITVNGRPFQVSDGQNVHAALLSLGIRTLGAGPRQDRNRSVFCGMGVCFECLVSINGRPDRRACMCEVEDGMEIEFHAL